MAPRAGIGRKEREEDDCGQGDRQHQERIPKDTKEEEMMEARTVLFVQYTSGGVLAKRVREVLARLQGLIGCSVKVVERTGTPLARSFPLTRLWEGTPCSREDCPPCTQGGEELYPCTRRNLVYENVCQVCKPKTALKKELREVKGTVS